MKNFTVSLFSFLLFINQTLAVSKRGIAWPWFEKHPVSDFYANGKVGWVNIHALLFMVLLEVVADFFRFGRYTIMNIIVPLVEMCQVEWNLMLCNVLMMVTLVNWQVLQLKMDLMSWVLTSQITAVKQIFHHNKPPICKYKKVLQDDL